MNIVAHSIRRFSRGRSIVMLAFICVLVSLFSLHVEFSQAPIARAASCEPQIPGCLIKPKWSGYEVYADTFDDVKGEWDVQIAVNPIPSSALGTWVGVGGVNSQNLAQTGTAWSNGAFHPFYEFYPNLPVIGVNTNLAVGTHIVAEVYKSGSNWCTSVTWPTGDMHTCSVGGFAADQSTAEWIDERPSPCNTLLHFSSPDGNYTHFSGGYAHSITRGWHTIGGFPRYPLQLVDENDGKTTLAAPLALQTGTTAFYDHWEHAGITTSLC